MKHFSYTLHQVQLHTSAPKNMYNLWVAIQCLGEINIKNVMQIDYEINECGITVKCLNCIIKT